jgi:hypothetical protein
MLLTIQDTVATSKSSFHPYPVPQDSPSKSMCLQTSAPSIPEACQTAAGGRSEAETPGRSRTKSLHPGGVTHSRGNLQTLAEHWQYWCSISLQPDAPFPLTPALSLGEREPRWRVLEDPWRLEQLHRLKQLSVPEGPSGTKEHSVSGAERSWRFGLANRGARFSLSLRERAGVRGNGTGEWPRCPACVLVGKEEVMPPHSKE